jgi:hypothetical protein
MADRRFNSFLICAEDDLVAAGSAITKASQEYGN